ncbi:RAM signaling pathway protein-domain-containing protein [Cristinia sonorae]|uniref:RAM signaling pathway protein-domain-containing protein n=1 Tax=Cristinia sonorae TaxID=1940300 RepID=A0A8K0UZA3_9AGAR|nr:RAM signaling pathway protein-domain-containing protein [Cristinia sonorae]
MIPSDADALNGRSTPARNGSLSPLPSVSLSREHITEALSKSPDGGATLDLAHKSLTDVGEDGAEELATIGRDDDDGTEGALIRIALAHNRLTTLPMAFALLSRLRYLVLKANNFTIFPDVLTVMPSLEILDISRNKIKRLPSQPGSLTNLRVFSVSRNKIHRLPVYFTQFKELNLFRADQNPMEWPPKNIMEHPAGEESPAMKDWIRSVQNWIVNNTSNVLDRKASEDSTTDTDDSYADESLISSSYLDGRSFVDAPLHSRSFSLESNASIYSDMAALHSKGDAGISRSAAPSRLRLDVLPSSRAGSSSSSPLRSPSSYLPTPDEPISSTDDDSTITRRGHDPTHSRNASAGPSRSNSRHRTFAKKSLPDLRQSITTDIAPTTNGMHHSNHGIPSPPHRQESDSSNGSLANLHRSNILAHESISTSPSTVDRPPPPMDVERNSYFRRLSTLSSATISKTIPTSILTLVDAIRGILFAVSQIYQTLQHYTVYAIDERLSAVLMKVLDPASLYMHQLINALDRFDTASRRQLPAPAICRAVVETCRDTVTVFGKAVGVLSLQLKVLATHDDVRYTRQMLLVLYGAVGEIGSAWQVIAGQIDAVRPLLSDHRPPPVKAFTAATATMRQASMSVLDKATPLPTPATAPLVPSAPFGFSQGQGLLRSNSGHATTGPRVSRRHAGSFSLKDVEIGKMLPSHIEAPHLTAGVIGTSASPTPRGVRRPSVAPMSARINGTAHAPSTPGTTTPSSALPMRWDSHSRQGSQNSLLASMSSPSMGFKKPSIDLANSKSNTLVDKEAIDAMKVAVDAAPPVWEMSDEILATVPETKEQLSGVLERAKALTEKLRTNISVLESGDVNADRGTFREDAHGFAKIVIQLSSALKAHGSALPATLRTNMVKLTNATQEFVILLHVSSFSASTPRPYSPMISPMPNGASTPSLMSPSVTEDGRLGANLSRSRSVAPTPMSKLARPQSRDPPRSALPLNQTFKIPMPPRFGLLRSRSGEDYSAVPS